MGIFFWTKMEEIEDPKLSSRVELWQKRSDEHKAKQKINPFSGQWDRSGLQIDKTNSNYGRPVEGSLTEFRGKRAQALIDHEIIQLCHQIAEHGCHNDKEDSYGVSFGVLFEVYTKISNKIVGLLMRARKQKLVNFEGEMLYQGRDNEVIITCYSVPEYTNDYENLMKSDAQVANDENDGTSSESQISTF